MSSSNTQNLYLCGRWDSNPHGFPHTVLSRTPIPIRLRPQITALTLTLFAKKSTPSFWVNPKRGGQILSKSSFSYENR